MRNKLKIRIDISPLATEKISGVGNYTLLLTEALSKDKDVMLEPVYFNFLGRQKNPKISDTISKKNRFIPLRIYSKLSSYNIAPFWDVFKSQVDLTIFTNFDTWPVLKSRYVATAVHDLTYLHYPSVVEEKNLAHLKRVVPRTLKRADLIFTVSESVKDELIEEFDVDKNRVVVTHVPPDQSFKERVNKNHAKKVLNKYAITSKYIFFLGNFEPRKNLSNLINAYCLLPDHIKSEYSLVLAGGKGWKTNETQSVLDEAIGRGENISHIGYIDSEDSPALYQLATLFIMPSIYEGFGIPILESMLSETPVIASDIPVLRETAGVAALFFNPNEVGSIRNTILKVIKDDALKNKLIKLGIKNTERFSWEKNIASIKEAIEYLDRTK